MSNMYSLQGWNFCLIAKVNLAISFSLTFKLVKG